MINLNNFVTVNIDYESDVSSSGNRPVVVLLDDQTVTGIQRPDLGEESYLSTTYNSLTEFLSATSNSTTGALYKRVKLFFDNGGKKIHYITYSETAQTTTTSITEIEHLATDEIVIAMLSTNTEKIKTIAASMLRTLSGINEKLFLGSLNTYPDSESLIPSTANLILKFQPGSDYATIYGGLEMTIAAYLSKINIDTGSIQDYCFTSEYLDDFESAVLDDNVIFEKIKVNGKLNANINLVNEVRNYGGNTCGKQDLVNYFTKIVLTQTLTEKLVKLLQSKIKYNQTSISLISATITDELNRYKRCGYLSTDKIWTKGDRYDASGTYQLIANNTPLLLGYSFTILPLSSLTAEDRANHLLPAIYLFIADSYAIREINVKGKII